jgi:hypothetical protein
MTASVELYTFEDEDGTETGYSTFSAQEAKEHGRKYHLRVIANDYEWQDSEVAWDYLGDTGEPVSA